MIKFTVLSENHDNGCFKGEGGLSLYLEVDGQQFLLDTGYSDLFKTNAKQLKVDVDKVDTIIFTHGHSDHTNGVQYVEKGKTLVIHPDGFKRRWSKRKKIQVGFPLTEEETRENFNLITSRKPLQVFPNVYFLGEIPMVVDFEMGGNFSTTLDENLTVTDYTEDDSGIAIKTPKGLIVMTGCGHRGVCNAIEHAKEVTGEEKIYAVLGGFHLRDLAKKQSIVEKTINYFKDNNVEYLFLGHCITDDVIEYFEKEMKKTKIFKLASGKTFEIYPQAKEYSSEQSTLTN